ncbi:MAG: ribonuclease R [Rhodothermales bacterium]|jgi:ribonuclease R
MTKQKDRHNRPSQKGKPTRSSAPRRDSTIDQEAIIRFLGSAEYRPMRYSELITALQVPDGQLQAVSDILHDLKHEGVVVNLKHKGLALARKADVMSGRIVFTRGGAAFVNCPASKREVFIPPRDTGTAMPNDQVLVRLRPNRRGGNTMEGTVVRVEERASSTVVGTLSQGKHVWFVEPLRATIQHKIMVADPGEAELGDRVLVRIAEWDDPQLNPEGEIVEVIGPADDAALDTLSVIRAYELPMEFPIEVIQEAETAVIDEASFEGRLDFRRRFVFTIDPKTAKDYDDAISIEKSKGGWKLGVHIADVSHFVTPGSALDREALKRGTSVYLPDRVIPMLPEQLSNGLCSLHENRDRLAFSAFITLDENANVLRCEFRETVIHSRLRLTYEQALEVLENEPGAPLKSVGVDRRASERIHQVHELTRQLRSQRFSDGALNMSLPDVKIVIGTEGHIDALEPQSSDIAHELIEECMLLANEQVSRTLSGRGWTHMHRIHDEPSPEKLANLENIFAIAGIAAGDLTNRKNLVSILTEIADMPQAHAWNTAVLRSMKKAEYSHKSIGHFGLAKQFYSHFTSPIRRYPDLVEHRLLKALIAGKTTCYESRKIAEFAEKCSALESRAVTAERDVIELKKVRYFQDQLVSGDLNEYEAVVVDVKNHGVMIDVPEVQAYGMIHVSKLSDDFYEFFPLQMELRARNSNRVLRIGSLLSVHIARVDAGRRFFDFSPTKLPEATDAPPRVERKPKHDKKSKKHGHKKHDHKKHAKKRKH